MDEKNPYNMYYMSSIQIDKKPVSENRYPAG
jgi:hypothetical protein